MTSSIVRAAIAVVLPFSTPSTLAAEHIASDPALSEIVVTATRTPTPLSQLTVPVVVITRAQIERSLAGDAAELLAGSAGVEIARNGGPGQPASIFLRGTESNHTAVLVDGVRINPGTIGGAALQNVMPDSIERIEIVRGARSTLYGSDAIGGVVNITTRAGAADGATVGMRSGRYGTRELSLDGGTVLGERVSLGVNLVDRRSDGFAPQAISSLPRGYENRSANAQLRWAATDALTLKAQAWHAQGRSEYLGYDALFSFGPLEQRYRNAVYAATTEYRRGERLLRAVLSRAEDTIRQQQSSDHARTRRDTFDLQYTAPPFGPHLLTVGAIASHEQAASESFGTTYDVETDTRLVYAQDQMRFGRHDLLLAAAHTQHETFGDHATWNLEYGRALGERWRVTLATGTAFHAPDSTDRFGYGGNPALAPEQSRQVEAGLRWQPTAGQQLGLNVFDMRIDDLILFQLADPASFTYRNENVERARVRGVEAGYEMRVAAWLLQANATLQRPRNDSSGEPLLRRARQHYSLRVQYLAGALAAATEVAYSGARYDSAFPALVRLPGYSLVNLSVEYHLTPDWTALARIDNALDRSYQLVYGYNTPRRSLTLATRYRLY